MVSLILQHSCRHDGFTMNNVDGDGIGNNVQVWVEQLKCTAVYETVCINETNYWNGTK